MKRVFSNCGMQYGLKCALRARRLVTAFFIVAATASVSYAQTETIVRSADGVSYVSGGVGLESLDRLNAMVGDFNLKLVFAHTSGAYMSDVDLVIADDTGKTIVDARAKGPWFLARLPAGRYQLMASARGKSEKRQVTVAATGLQTVDFRWNVPE